MLCYIIFLCFIAKYNAEMYYAVIGLQEDIETSLCVMEAYVPLFFKGALKTYQNTFTPQAPHKGTPHKQTISDLARSILATNMTFEYEFYDFVKHRLKVQVKSLGAQKYPRNLCGGKPISVAH